VSTTSRTYPWQVSGSEVPVKICTPAYILCCVEFGLTEISWDKLRQCAGKNFHKLNVFISQMSGTWMK